MLSGFFYFNSLDWFISIRRGIWLVFIISSFFRNSRISCKQCRPWSDSAICGVWSGSTLFASVPFIGP